jgi:hypothetical protein
MPQFNKTQWRNNDECIRGNKAEIVDADFERDVELRREASV